MWLGTRAGDVESYTASAVCYICVYSSILCVWIYGYSMQGLSFKVISLESFILTPMMESLFIKYL